MMTAVTRRRQDASFGNSLATRPGRSGQHVAERGDGVGSFGVSGAAPYERNASQVGYGNGFKDRTKRSRLGELLEAWRSRDLGVYHYIVLDAQFEKVRQGGQVLERRC